jgi:hypothetical protein
VLTCSSSLPARDGALESSNGDIKGLIRSALAPVSEAQLLLREDMLDAAGDREGDSSSRNRWARDFAGGRRSSDDSATPGVLYRALPPPSPGGCGRGGGGAGRFDFVNRDGPFPEGPADGDVDAIIKRSCWPELSVICG